jgi:serine/threonine protein kinase
MPATRSPIILAVLNGAERGRIIVLDGSSPAVLGRGEDADVQLSPADEHMGRRQALLAPSGGEWSLAHIPAATNPTRVNGVPGDHFVLADGDKVHLGDTQLNVRLHIGHASALRCDRSGCGADLSLLANRDHRVLELMDVATYLCPAHVKGEAGGRAVGHYRLCDILGSGGAGIVHRAIDERTGRVVALKQLLDTNVEQVRRFDQEIRKLRELRHANIVRFIDCGSDDKSHPYLVTEFAPQGNLNQLFQQCQSRVSIDLAVDIAIQALDGLRFLHSRRIFHRDLKPENVILRNATAPSGGRNYLAKIADLGLLRELDGIRLTRPDDAAGSLSFMPPQQLGRFSSLVADADTYSLGATLYFLVSGHAPIDLPEGAGRGECLRIVSVADRAPIRSRVPSLPVALAAVIDRACAKESPKRFQTAEEFQNALLAARDRMFDEA